MGMAMLKPLPLSYLSSRRRKKIEATSSGCFDLVFGTPKQGDSEIRISAFELVAPGACFVLGGGSSGVLLGLVCVGGLVLRVGAWGSRGLLLGFGVAVWVRLGSVVWLGLGVPGASFSSCLFFLFHVNVCPMLPYEGGGIASTYCIPCCRLDDSSGGWRPLLGHVKFFGPWKDPS